MKLLDDKNVKTLIKVMDLDVPKAFLEVSLYDFRDGKIEIKEIKVLDVRGKFIRFANIKKVLPYLSEYNVTFKEL